MSLSDRIRSRTKQAREAFLSTADPQTKQSTGDYASFTVQGETNSVSPDAGDIEAFWGSIDRTHSSVVGSTSTRTT